MIYRCDRERGTVYEALDWRLYSRNDERIPLKSEEELRAYLRTHPDEDFELRPADCFNREVQAPDANSFDPHGAHIRCGTIRYDSASRKLVTK
jgi:hypothetical protein